MKPGVLDEVFHHLKQQVPTMKEEEKLCVLMFDEMSVQPHLDYCRHEDRVVGFVDDGTSTKPILADHSQVFMLRGIMKKWKQPVAYNFCNATTSAADIVRLYKDIVTKCYDVGLTVVASVCDQGATNVRAIRMLLEESRGIYMRNLERNENDTLESFNNIILLPKTKSNEDGCLEERYNMIVPIYDPPHLLKSIRNNLLQKNLKFVLHGEQQERIAKWDHVILSYQVVATIFGK